MLIILVHLGSNAIVVNVAVRRSAAGCGRCPSVWYHSTTFKYPTVANAPNRIPKRPHTRAPCPHHCAASYDLEYGVGVIDVCP
jgi:hypothetical protein